MTTGESMYVVTEARSFGWSGPAAVHPSGIRIEPSIMISSALLPSGKRISVFQATMPAFAVALGPEVKLPPAIGERYERSTSTALAPRGTSMANTYILRGSRRQVSACPLALIRTFTRFVIGPVGPCSPGIHCAYASRIGPGTAGIVECE